MSRGFQKFWRLIFVFAEEFTKYHSECNMDLPELGSLSIFIFNLFHSSMKVSYLPKLLALVVTEVSVRTSLASVTAI